MVLNFFYYITMKDYEIWAFCSLQSKFVMAIVKIFPFSRLIITNGCGAVPHPLTDQIYSYVYYMTTYHWVYHFIYLINEKLLTKEGKKNRDILIQCGKIHRI